MNRLTVLAVPIGGMIFIAGVSYAAFRHTVAEHQEVVQQHALDLIYVEKLRSAFEWKVASSRGFFLTRDEIFLERETAARAEFKHALDYLKKNFRGPDQRVLDEIDRAEDLHQRVVAELKEIRKSDDMARTTEVFEKQVWPRREELRLSIAALERAEQAEFEKAIARSAVATQNALRYSSAAIIAAFLLAAYTLVTGIRHLTSVARREAQLRKQAEEALAGRAEFLSIVSHELRTPIYALKLQLDLLRRRLERGATLAEQEEFVIRSDRQLASLTHLMDGLFDLVRYERGQFELRYANVDLASLARELTERFCGRGVDVQCRVDGPMSIFVQADPRRIEQAMVNLLTNAIKYGGGKPVSVGVTCDDKYAAISVKDQGPGIAPQDRERIFRRFERLRADGGATHGLGLGLYIARRIADAHGGTLTVDSEPGKGAMFTLRLPREPHANVTADAAGNGPSASGEGDDKGMRG